MCNIALTQLSITSFINDIIATIENAQGKLCITSFTGVSPECYDEGRVFRLCPVDEERTVSVVPLQQLLSLRQRLDSAVQPPHVGLMVVRMISKRHFSHTLHTQAFTRL